MTRTLPAPRKRRTYHGHDRKTAGVVRAAVEPHLRVAALEPKDLRNYTKAKETKRRHGPSFQVAAMG